MAKQDLGDVMKMELETTDFDYRPFFFKLMFDGLNSEKLRIPPNFVKYISKDLSGRATLIGPSGRCWHAKVNKSTCGIYVESGWKNFVKEHSLGDNEFLIFRYDGNMCFTIQIFDQSGVERTNISISRQHQQFPLPKRKPGRPRKYPIRSNPCEDGPARTIQKVKEKKGIQFPLPKRKPGRPRKYPIRSNPCEDGPARMIQKAKEKKGIQIKEEIGMPVPDMDAASRKKNSGEQPPPSEGRARTQKEAESFTSPNPYFMSFLSKGRMEVAKILVVPAHFQKHLPRIKATVVLRNLKGKSWVVNAIPINGRHHFCGGWSAFARDNNLKIGDICIFELLTKYEMQVHVFSD